MVEVEDRVKEVDKVGWEGEAWDQEDIVSVHPVGPEFHTRGATPATRDHVPSVGQK
jgi:hypothetical protein